MRTSCDQVSCKEHERGLLIFKDNNKSLVKGVLTALLLACDENYVSSKSRKLRRMRRAIMGGWKYGEGGSSKEKGRIAVLSKCYISSLIVCFKLQI